MIATAIFNCTFNTFIELKKRMTIFTNFALNQLAFNGSNLTKLKQLSDVLLNSLKVRTKHSTLMLVINYEPSFRNAYLFSHIIRDCVKVYRDKDDFVVIFVLVGENF